MTDSGSCSFHTLTPPPLELHNHLVTTKNRVPTILITAFPDDRDRGRALQAGVTCYLAKPYDDEELLGCVRLAVDSRDAG
jgi:DNA-binding response OmpR family regulator